MRCGLSRLDFEGKKQAYYDAKNNENIDWRKLLMLHAKRFIYLVNNNINLKSVNKTALIFDDSLLEKTGKKIEKVSMVHDHVSGRFILGYKLLVCGFWDGENFIPIDFSLHREKGRQQDKYLKAFQKSLKEVAKTEKELSKLVISEKKIAERYNKHNDNYQLNATKTNKKHLEKARLKQNEIRDKITVAKKDLRSKKKANKEAEKKLRNYYHSGKMFGLSAKEREAQFKKAVSTKSHGFKRRSETDKNKIDSMLTILGRVVKAGIIPNYVIVDSWFFCAELMSKLQGIKKGVIKLVGMVKISNQIFTLCRSNKEMSVKNILKIHQRNAKRCKKFKAQYIKVACFYNGIRTNLFFVRMGKCKTWRLIATTDLSLSFIQLMEVYQIRWSIEVFFRDSKQYLHLSDCQSNTFDAQIADITISMMQYIMLSYFKRINYQQTIGGLFESIAKELEELDLVSRLVKIFFELIKVVCEISGIDFIELQHDIMKNNKAMKTMQKLLPEKIYEEAA
jgi:hypothetical protein